MKLISKRLFHPSELILILAGLFVLVSVLLISLTGSFDLWIIAKILYALGVILFIFNI